MSAAFESVPVVKVNKDNISDRWASLTEALKGASFIALDCELSGLGDRKKLNSRHMDDRYEQTKVIANKYAIISVGVSAFKLLNIGGDPKCRKYVVQTFNLLSLCQDEYMVEPGALKFLVEHGFDFNEQYKSGIPYYKKECNANATRDYLKDLFSLLVLIEKPIVFHNAMVDLLFLYENLYATLPKSWSSFLQDMLHLFGKAGIYDTKYITDYHARMSASYLQYVFKKLQVMNLDSGLQGKPHVGLLFPPYPNCDWVDRRSCPLPKKEISVPSNLVCETFANHGHCPLKDKCRLSHDINDIVSSDIDKRTHQVRRQRRKRKQNGEVVSVVHESSNQTSSKEMMQICDEMPPPKETVQDGNTVSPSKEVQNGDMSSPSKEVHNCDISKPTEQPKGSGCHRAGYDAFMTGFCFAVYLMRHSGIPVNPQDFLPSSINARHLVNRLYLVALDHPAVIAESNFSKPSKLGLERLEKLKNLGIEKIINSV